MPEDRTVLITGASMGLGHAMAEALAEDGWTVFGTSREPENYSTHGWEMIELDVTDDTSVRACVDGVMERTGRIDALVNNAGYGLSAFAEEASVEEVRAQFDTNYLGVHRMNRAVLPIMRRQGRGHIVNISSLSGLIGTPPSAHYSASKHALEGYSQTMRLEVARFGVQVAIVEPGFTESEFRANLAEPAEPIAAYDDLRDQMRSMNARAEESATPAIAVARTVRRVLRTPRPRLRYTCTRTDWLAAHMRCWLPEGAMHLIVRKVFGV
ncbi:MAG: SDR family NAD(P)-dependent oxidoreductase [Armatimonadota bacterium]|jgi:NAD(P)-dependent dehydrogenase (short-subunit alcohol dehydrogenase family)